MRLFRSEAHLKDWLEQYQLPAGATLTLPQVWALSKAWYGNRLQANFRGWKISEAEEIFKNVGLSGPFWKFK